MIRLREHLHPEDLRRLNRDLFTIDPTYLASDVWTKPATETLRHINNVRSGDIQEAIDAVAPFDETSVATAWSHHMALHCGIHYWPDANHRTAIFGFNVALQRAVGWHVGMDPDSGKRCVVESKALRKNHYPRLTVAKLVDPDHPYRRVFTEFESVLIVKEAGAGLLY